MPVGPCGPVAPAGPTGPAGPLGPVGPIEPAGPAGPTCPAGPVAPAGPVGPAGPVAPTSCVESRPSIVSALIAYGAGYTACRGASSSKLPDAGRTSICSHTGPPVNTVVPKSSAVVNIPPSTGTAAVSNGGASGTPMLAALYGVTRKT